MKPKKDSNTLVPFLSHRSVGNNRGLSRFSLLLLLGCRGEQSR
ncbi:hypothetical protein HM1_0797 [Heliomicrobium modesticaldum Ice1]|uniref:Uncharacterized protein n=1 Tax=Heliobacterium modesticaldum (strain ATCC 51547 / Ice1) TaxID=498761 RepID=B0TB31_HELMI|nr:hypothetical protein HM1_0797 [Heliomicrobium modesticaldum Ice1]